MRPLLEGERLIVGGGKEGAIIICLNKVTMETCCP